MYTIEYLKANSHLPGPRGNLELLYEFSKNADCKTINACLTHIGPATLNSPEEFLGMCGILGYAVLNKKENGKVVDFLKLYASHKSWRIREAVAIAIQELCFYDIEETVKNLKPMINGDYLQQRAIVAGLCEPKLLKRKEINLKILNILEEITLHLTHEHKLSDSEESLRKTLGYGWSVLIAASPLEGKQQFEKLFDVPGKHVKWIIKENLKKNRLLKMDSEWVANCNKFL